MAPVMVSELGGTSFSLQATICDECSQRMDVDDTEELRACMATIPPEFRQTWDHGRGNTVTLREIIKGLGKSRSIYVHGTWGTCKTRAVCHLAARMIVEKRRRIRFWSCDELAQDISACFKASPTQGRTLIREQLTFDVVILDDLGVATVTERVGEAFYSIINGRYQRNLPVWATSNYDAEGLMRRFGPDYGPKIVRRLTDMCVEVRADECAVENKARGG